MLQSILFLLVIATVIFLRSKLRDTPLAKLSPTHQSLIALGVLLLLLLALTGKLGLLIPLFGAVAAAFVALVSRVLPLLTPFLSRHLHEWIEGFRSQRDPSAPPHSRAQTSSVKTLFLDMSLSHGDGQIDGHIRQGPLAGQRLTSLSLSDLMDLYRYYADHDMESARLLAAFMERRFGQQWQHESKAASTGTAPLDRKEALSILGLGEDATAADIIAAHRKLIQRVHPDRGGSDYLASRINQAKDALLGPHSNQE